MNGKSRTFLRTHPWISFRLDLSRVAHTLWMNLGAAQSKCEHVAGTLLPHKVAQELHQMYLAKGLRATTAIEGNTLSEEQVRQRIEQVDALPPSLEYQGREIDNLVEACNEIARQLVEGGDGRLTADTILDYNRQILAGLPGAEEAAPGQIRQHQVVVGRYRGAPPEDCAYLLDRFCAFINDDLRAPTPHHQLAFGVLRAVTAHLYFAWIHPFGDGNGRTARLIEFHLLLAAGVPAVSAHLLSNHYNQTRPEYYRRLELARESASAFLEYAVQGFVDQLDLQIRRIRRYQHDSMWRDLVYETLRGEQSPAAHRQRLLALELGKRKTPVRVDDLTNRSPELARAYARKTTRTLSRDLRALVERGLLTRGPGGVSAQRSLLENFRPARRAEEHRQ